VPSKYPASARCTKLPIVHGVFDRSISITTAPPVSCRVAVTVPALGITSVGGLTGFAGAPSAGYEHVAPIPFAAELPAFAGDPPVSAGDPLVLAGDPLV